MNNEKITTYMIVSSIILMVSGLIANRNETGFVGIILILAGSALLMITIFSELLYGIWKAIHEKKSL
jgi:hypothetical protein